jgi:ribonuclease HI
MLKNKTIIYTDGGSRGNPGPSALGVVIEDERGKILKEYSHYLGEATNNQAEYEAVIFALQKAKQMKIKELEIRTDSELIGKQLLGEYKIKDPDLQPLFIKAWNLRLDYEKVNIKIIPREQNKKADKLANRELDAKNKLF